MKITCDSVENAENMSSCYEEAMDSIRNAIEALKDAHDATADGFASALGDILSDIQDDSEQYNEILDEADRKEHEVMLREYWRAVV